MNLDEKFRKFALSFSTNECVDKLPSNIFSAKKADYLFNQRSMIVEVKYLNQDRSEAVNDKLNELANADPTFPQFFGNVNVEEIINRHQNSNAFRQWLCDYAGRTLDGVVRNAHHQIFDTRRALKLEYSTGMLVLLNDSIALYNDAFVEQEVARILHKQKGGRYERDQVEAVWFINEYKSGESKVISSSVYIGPAAKNDKIVTIMNMLHVRWAAYSGTPMIRDQKSPQ